MIAIEFTAEVRSGDWLRVPAEAAEDAIYDALT